MDGCTTGAARSTSQVVKITFACCPINFNAQAVAVARVLPWVSHVFRTILCPSTPPFPFQYPIRIFAAASAGPSNGAIAPLPSNAQPITIGLFVALALALG